MDQIFCRPSRFRRGLSKNHPGISRKKRDQRRGSNSFIFLHGYRSKLPRKRRPLPRRVRNLLQRDTQGLSLCPRQALLSKSLQNQILSSLPKTIPVFLWRGLLYGFPDVISAIREKRTSHYKKKS